MKDIFLKNAVAIGDKLLALAKHNKYGTYWESVESDADNTIFIAAFETICSGTCGPVLFLLALYKQTKDTKYLQTAKDALQWVEAYCEKFPSDNYALMTGRMGVVFTYLTMYQITEEKIYLKSALALAKNTHAFLKHPHQFFDYMNGIAGTILGLLFLHSVSKVAWILPVIETFTEELLSNAKQGNAGIYWDTQIAEIRPLCGFSHGPSGIGFVFLELGHYFQNPAFYYIAEQAFIYEDQFYDKSKKSWPDFRLNMYNNETVKPFEQAFKKHNFTMFMKVGSVNQWCHGPTGIGLARARGFQLLQNQTYKTDLKNVVSKTLHESLPSFTYCHGQAGFSDMFLESYLITKNLSEYDSAAAVGIKAIDELTRTGRNSSGSPFGSEDVPVDITMFTGIAGIGYMYLRLIDPDLFPSLLAPKINDKITDTSNKLSKITVSELKLNLLRKAFPETYPLLDRYTHTAIKTFIAAENTSSLSDTYIQIAEKALKELPADKAHQLAQILAMEKERLAMVNNTKSNGLLYIREKLAHEDAEKLLALDDKSLKKKRFILSDTVRIFSLPQQQIRLLKLAPGKVHELQINTFCEQILKSFIDIKPVEETVEEILILFSVENKNRAEIENKILQQIRDAVNNGILIPEEYYLN